MTASSDPEPRPRIQIKTDFIFGGVVILISMLLIMGVMIGRKAIDPEALANFRFMRDLNFIQAWTGESFPGHFVTYRPMMAALLRLEYLVFGFNPPAYFSVNLALLAVVALFIYDIIYRKTGEMLPAALGALFFITDWQIVQTLYVIGEVQVTLAGIFGLWALWLVWFGKERGKLKPVFIFILLLASALSKEFGLAFTLAVLMDAVLKRKADWKTYAGIAVGAAVAFAALRFMVIPETPSGKPYSSIFNMLKWFSYNIGSGFIFTFINLFRPASDGDLPSLDALRFHPIEAWGMVVLQIIPVILLFVLGFKDKEDRKLTVPFLFLLLGNSLLFFFNYAFRFHFLGKIGMYAVVGFGISYIYKKWSPNLKTTTSLIVTVLYLSGILLWRGRTFHAYLVEHLRWTVNEGLCIPGEAYYQQEDFFGYYTVTDPDTVATVIDYYNLPIVFCDCLDPYSLCGQTEEGQ